MKIKAMIVLAMFGMTTVLSACAEDSSNENAATTVQDTQWYCLDENSSVVDEDYCEPDESEYDPDLYYLWAGPVGLYTVGAILSDSHSKKAKAKRSSAPTAKPAEKPKASVGSSSKPKTNSGTSSKPKTNSSSKVGGSSSKSGRSK